jgi:cytochrome d ubiquinol oxidase subunit II
VTAVQATAIVLLAGVTTYAVFGGADFGAGFWDLVAGRATDGLRPRALIADAIGPVWEANHTWLVFDLVVIWTAFPPAFAAIMTALFVPVSLVALGMVLRGAAFAFRPVATGLRGRRAAGAVFAASSVLTPFLLAAVAGAIASGRVPATAGDAVAADPWTIWLNPTSILLGLMAVAVCAYLAAVFLVADARRRSDDELVGYFRRRAMAAAVVAGGLAIGAIPVLAIDAPLLADGLTARGWPFVIASGALGAAALALLWRDRPRGTRACAVGAVVAVMVGWGVAQYPYILPPSMTFQDAAAPSGSLEALLVIFVVAAVVIAPSLALLYSLDQRDRLKGHGVGTDVEPDSVQESTSG